MNPTQIQLSDFVGEHGPYQLSISFVLFFRYVFLGLMANSGPLMTPDVTFYCSLPMEEIVAIMPNISLLNKTEQTIEIREEFKRICQIDLHLYQQAYINSSKFEPQLDRNKLFTGHQLAKFNSTDKIRECSDFTYDIALDQGKTMTSEFDLICDRDWLRSLFQSLISAAIVIAHVFWGTFSDKYGRFRAQKLCAFISLISGGLSILAMDFWSFVICRALCSFGDLGLAVSLTTTVVELVGNQYRGLSVAMVNFGYALGVSILPYIVAYFEDFRLVITFTVLCHLATMPFIFTTNESIRWLLTNRKFHSAKKELKRIVRWNKRFYRVLKIWPFNYCCCCFTPHIVALGSRHHQYNITSQSNTHGQANKVKRKISNLEKKALFEVLFKNFIDQIENQNFCDPLGPTLVQMESPSFTSATTSPLNTEQTGLPTIGIGSCLEASRDLEVEDLKSKLAESGRPSISAVATTGSYSSSSTNVVDTTTTQVIQSEPRSVMMTIQENNNNNAMSDSQSQDQSIELAANLQPTAFEIPQVLIDEASSCCELSDDDDDDDDDSEPKVTNGSDERDPEASIKLDWSHLQAPFARAESCGHLDQNINLKGRRRAHFLLNIPANDPNLNVSQDFRDAHFFRKRGQGQPDCMNLVASQLTFVGRVSRLFKDKQLMIVVFTIVWTTFNSELQYTSFIIINLEVGEDVYLNYILGGCMEAIAAIIASLLLSYAPRRLSLIIFWLLISGSCFALAIAHIDSTWAVWLLALAKFSQSCLSSIAGVAAYESFPTFLRQSGSGLVFTIGGLGSVFAPIIFAEFDDHAGMDRVLMTFSLSSLTAAILIFMYLKETKDCELN